MRNLTRKVALVCIALIATAGIVATPSAADADTGWGFRVIPGHHAK